MKKFFILLSLPVRMPFAIVALVLGNIAYVLAEVADKADTADRSMGRWFKSFG